MKFKSEFVKAVKLYLLLCLLFWSFTWNSNDLDFSDRKAPTEIAKEIDGTKSGKSDFGMLFNKRFVDYVLSVGDEVEKTSESIYILPFNEWKQKEMTKYASPLLTQEESNINKKDVRRKLNYASSKCGAKVLASNSEAKHRNSVLSEKNDEYLLNPCRVRTWFIVELCDTVEATQIDLANYELYSSSPREFSVFWSDVYPTAVWHLLGSFEAKDQRTVQTFPILTKNLGKFIKVIIYNHHGKEHYCPLSVLRVLGYSMVQKFEDTENPENIPEYGRSSSPRLTNNSTKLLNPISSTFSIKFCIAFLKYCGNNRTKNTENVCLNLPICRFLMEIMRTSKVNCLELFCLSDKSERTTKISKINAEVKQIRLGPSKGIDLDTLKSKRYSVKPTYRKVLSSNTNKQYEIVTEKFTKSDRWKKSGEIQEAVKLNSSIGQVDINGTRIKKDGLSKMKERCICESNMKENSIVDKVAKDDDMRDFLEEGESIESAKLIHKDSVLFKLTARLKVSQRDLNLINKYLQQLSQSYRQQMKDMKFMFDRTLKMVNITSEKAGIVDIKQEKNIIALEKKTTSLSRKIDFLMNEQRHLIKKVAELHCFFIILEIIIISTMFTIFLNIFQRKRLKSF